MFKHYLTYQFALTFHQLCLLSAVSNANQKSRLIRSAEQMIHSMTLALHAPHKKREASHWFSALVNLRDCKDILVDALQFEGEIKTKLEILNDRFEKICENLAKAEDGQYRMLG